MLIAGNPSERQAGGSSAGRRLLLCLLVALLAAAALASAARAQGTHATAGPAAPGLPAVPSSWMTSVTGALTAQAASCFGHVLVNAFAPFGDPNTYTLVPGGNLADVTGWTLAGAAVVPGGVPSADGDVNALSLPPGSQATTRPMCITAYYPTLRLFARNTGASSSALKVEALFEDHRGNTLAAPIATIKAQANWQPTAPIRIWVNLRALIATTGTAAIALRFTPQGAGGNWTIDEIYVDPFKSR